MNDAPLLVLRDKFTPGAGTFEEAGALLHGIGVGEIGAGDCGMFGVVEAFERGYDSDAHYMQYALFENNAPIAAWPRLKKEILQFLPPGLEVRATILPVDLDTEGHRLWGPGGPSKEPYFEGLVDALESDPVLRSWWGIHATRAGARVIYRPVTAMAVSLVEPYIGGLLARMEGAGVRLDRGTFQVDWACADWKRPFRLPKVVRDGEATNEEVMIRHERRIDLASIAPASKASRVAVRAYEGSMPAEDETVRLEGDGDLVKWKKLALKQLGGTEAGQIARGERLMVPGGGQEPSGRNDAIQRVIGQAVSHLHVLKYRADRATPQDPGKPEDSQTCPEAIYALFLPAVQQFTPDESSSKSWPRQLWEAVCKYWAADEAKAAREHEAQATKAVVKQVQGVTAVNSLLAGFSSWCFDPEFTQCVSDSDKANYILRHMVASPSGHTYYALQQDGYYSPVTCSKEVLVAHMTSSRVGSHHLIDFERVGDNGKINRLAAQEILDKHCTLVSRVLGGPKTKTNPGGILLQNGDVQSLWVPLYAVREDLDPTYCGEVQGWLESFGEEDLIDYVAKTLDLDLIMNILSISGPASAGKGMFMRGLTECITTETTATERDFGTFSPKILESPFLYVNEGLSNVDWSEISDTVRQLTGGDSIQAVRKFQGPVEVLAAVRLVVTANNESVVTRLLGQDRDLTERDRNALLQRLVHMEIGEGPVEYLQKLGGRNYTGREGAKWVRGRNKKTDYRVAKHFLWLTHNWKRKPEGDRFAMAGKAPTHLIKEMNLGAGTTPVVVESLLRFIESYSAPNSDGLVIAPANAPDRVYVTASALVDFYRGTDEGKRNPHKVNVRTVGSLLKTLRCPGSSSESREVKNGKGIKVKTRWWEIPLKTLQQEAEEHGYKCEKVKRALEGLSEKAPS